MLNQADYYSALENHRGGKERRNEKKGEEEKNSQFLPRVRLVSNFVLLPF